MQQRQRRRLGLSALPLLVIAMLVPASAQAATADLAISKADSPDPVVEGNVLTGFVRDSRQDRHLRAGNARRER